MHTYGTMPRSSICLIIIIGIFTHISTSSADEFRTGIPVFNEDRAYIQLRGYATDPTGDIAWSEGTACVEDIQTAFNNARATENLQLGLSLPMLVFPSQAEWDNMSDDEKSLWLINRERVDRNVMPLHGIEENVDDIAQYYARYLLDNDAWGHSEDGNDPWDRLETSSQIAVCRDFLNVAENLAVFVTFGTSINLPIERSIYMWMYDDGDCCSWGHRHAILWTPYTNNSGFSATEGFLGIGRVSGGPYQGPFTSSWNHAEIIVMNVFDPCPDWDYSPLVRLQNALIGLDLLSGEQVSAADLIHADTDQDGKLELEDVIMLIRYFAGL